MDSSPHQTLGCDCASPTPRSPSSALCAECGLVYMTFEQYDEHLARCRAEVAAILQAEPEVEGVLPRVEQHETTVKPAAERESRRWFKRRRHRAAAPAA